MADTSTLQRDADVVTYSTFTGLRNDVSPERVELSDLVVADNIDIDASGSIARRAGFTNVAVGATHSLWADDTQQQCLCVSGGALNRLNSDYTLSPLRALANANARMDFTKVGGRVYFSNGQDLGVVENGAARTWGLQVPSLPAAAAVVGNMPAGAYQYALTFLRSDGQESGAAPLAGTIQLPASGGIQFTLPVSPDPDVTAKVLYISPPNGEVLFAAVVVANSVATTTYTGDPSALSEALMTQNLGPPPAGQLVAFYRGRMFVAVDDTIFMSEPYAYELFDLRRYVQLDSRITLMAPMTDKDANDAGRGSGFFVGTDRSCGILVGSDPDDFQYVAKTNYGAIFGALDYVDGTLLKQGEAGARPLPIWLTTQGICVGMPDLVIDNITRGRYTFSAAGRGAAVFMPGPDRFIATANL